MKSAHRSMVYTILSSYDLQSNAFLIRSAANHFAIPKQVYIYNDYIHYNIPQKSIAKKNRVKSEKRKWENELVSRQNSICNSYTQ